MALSEAHEESYRKHLTGDPVYDEAFKVLADCPTFTQVEKALNAYAHGLAEKIRDAVQGDDPDYIGTRGALWGADLIDSEEA